MNKTRTFRLTRSKPFLFKSSAVLMVGLLALGTAVSFLNRGRLDAYERIIATPKHVDEQFEHLGEQLGEQVNTGVLDGVIRETLSSDREFHVKLRLIASLLYYLNKDGSTQLSAIGKVDAVSDEQALIAEALIMACSNPDRPEAILLLQKTAEAEAPAKDANYALALVLDNRDDNPGMLKALKREIELHNSQYARKHLIRAYLKLDKYEAVEALAHEPGYEELITPIVLRDIALDRMDWKMILKTHFASAYGGTNWILLLLALVSGWIWATVVVRFGGAFSNVWKFAVPAIVLGALSAHATLFSVYWQEYQMGFGFGETALQQLIYCLTIGLREEGLKLLLFVPLIPFLRNKDDLVVLTVAGLVGLGFALEENINYFEASAGLSATARFVTANFLHIALTAMCGLTLTRAIVHRGEDIQHAAVTFIIAVAIHGFYDAFIMVYALADYSWLTYAVFILMGYQYFGWLRHLRDEWDDPVSITAVFTYGLIVVAGLSYAIFAWNSGPFPAFQAIAQEALGITILLFMFYREIPEALN